MVSGVALLAYAFVASRLTYAEAAALRDMNSRRNTVSRENLGYQLQRGFATYVYTTREDDSGQISVVGAPPVLFTHLLKAGGTRICNMLKQLFKFEEHYLMQSYAGVFDPGVQDAQGNAPSKLSKLLNESLTGVASATENKIFRIGSIRSPCDYLLSMWSFQSMPYGASTGHGRPPRDCLLRTHPDADSTLYGQNLSANLMTEADIQRFRSWVHATSGERLHYFSLRAYFALHSGWNATQSWDDGQYYACMSDNDQWQQKQISLALASTNLSERYDCLIHTESLESELRACMMKYANVFIQNDEARRMFLAKVESIDWTPQQGNPSRHGKCNDYFDESLANFVWAREGPFAFKVGYESCCAR